MPLGPRLRPEAARNLALGGLRAIVEYLRNREDSTAADELGARRRAESAWPRRDDSAEWRGLAACDLTARRMRRETPPPTLAEFAGLAIFSLLIEARRSAASARICRRQTGAPPTAYAPRA